MHTEDSDAEAELERDLQQMRIQQALEFRLEHQLRSMFGELWSRITSFFHAGSFTFADVLYFW